MQVMNVIAEILKREGISTLFCFPTTPIIEAAAAVGIKPVICRQERVGVHMADGFARVSNGKPPGVFAMQYGPGAENAFAGVATAFSDSTPVLFLPLGHPARPRNSSRCSNRAAAMPRLPNRSKRYSCRREIGNIMRRAFAQLKNGRSGPVMVEVQPTSPPPRLTSTRASTGRSAPADRPATRATSRTRRKCCSTPPVR